jgi:hypothetical protein
MSHQRRKLPSALKHGVYSATDILPGESQVEFKKWHRRIIAELHPTGALEEQAVYDVARYTWRKRNMMTLRFAERAQQRKAIIKDKQIPHVLRQHVEDCDVPELGALDADEEAVDTALRAELGGYVELVDVGRWATFEGLIQDLRVEDLLDSKIDRALKRLLHLKGVKSLTDPKQIK